MKGGTLVDGSRVVNSYTLSPQSVIRINGYRFTFRGSELVEYDETAGKVRIDIRDLTKVVPLPGGEERVLLNNISLRVEPQEFVAILGGSGAGKTTLLKALMGTWPANFGEILINGINYYHEYGALQSMIGYVPQDDIVHLDLTVEEVLNYAARLRMPDDTLRDERAVRVEEIMQVLGLTSRRSNLVRDLSGGQRKRVSIGVELITRPGIMFLDEPTSGLDPGLEKVMMEMMRGMADGGQTIFLVTHATFNIHLCDKVIFLTEGGRLAFFGTPQEALKYFNTDNFAEIYKKVAMEKSPERWQQRYNMSETAARYQPQSCSSTTGEYSIDAGRTRTSSLFQWYDLTCRYARVMIRDRENVFLLFLQPVIIAALLCILFYYAVPVFDNSPYQPGDLLVTEEAVMAGEIDEISDRNQEENRRRRNMDMLTAAMVLTAIWFGTSNAAREIIKEINIYKRERLVNLRIAPYLMSKVAVLAIVCMVQSLIFLFIIRAVLGFPSYWLSVLAFYLISLSSVMMGLTVSALSANSNNAATAVPILLIPQFLLSGALIPMHQVEPEFFQVFFYLAVSKWGYELIGGGIVDINSLLAFEEPIKALDGSFGLHWFVLLGFILILYLFSTAAMLYKDRDLS